MVATAAGASSAEKAALHSKLGVKDGSVVTLLHEPAGVIGQLPPSVRVKRRLVGSSDLVVVFARTHSELATQQQRLGEVIFPDGALWVAWPKRSSRQATDLTDEVVRSSLVPLGLVDTKVCAIDGVWSGLRFVWRKELRTARAVENSP